MWELGKEQLKAENRLLQDCHNQVCKQLVEEKKRNENLEVRVETLLEFIVKEHLHYPLILHILHKTDLFYLFPFHQIC